MLNQVLESTLAFMVALLALSISAIVRIRPPASSPATNSEPTMAGEPMMNGNGLSPASLAPAGNGPTLWAASSPPGLLADGPDQRRASLLGRRYEARHVRGRAPATRQPSPAGPPWAPASPPPAGRPQQNSERWT
ncbi:MAG: hypothetical protein ACR2FU_19355 [Streptosporangiaceae bacterium]